MNNFLDKVGLQHFVEKIKSLLSGYLPLRGGTMTGSIKYGTLVSLSKKGLTCFNAQQPECSTEFGADGLCASYTNYNHPKYGFIPVGLAKVALTGIDIQVGGKGQATLSIEECKTNKFTLYSDSSSEGLIANNSKTVVKELTEEQIADMVFNNTSLDAGKYYMSGDSLSALVYILKYNDIYITIATTEDASFTRYSNGSTFTIPANTNYIMSKDLYAPTTEED